MQTIIHLPRPALLAAVFSLFLSLIPSVGVAADGELGLSAGTVSVPSGLTLSDVKDVIVGTLIGREWGVQSKTDDRVVGYLKHRSNEATITLIYDTNAINLYCVGWAINKKSGERRKPEQPEGWLKNLRTDLAKNLSKAASLK
jgi:hypothetical protein